jgi:phage replication O-like protein O
MEGLAFIRIPGEARQVLDVIMRLTLGWNKSEAEISLPQFSRSTGLTKVHVCRALAKLREMNLITQKGNNITQKGNNSLPKKVTHQLKQVKSKKQSPPIVPPTGGEGVYVADVLTDRFDRFYAVYPKKRSKAQALKAWRSIKPSEQLLATMIASVERAKTSVEWSRESGRFIPYPASWLNAHGWEDVYEQAPDPVRQSKQSAVGPKISYTRDKGRWMCVVDGRGEFVGEEQVPDEWKARINGQSKAEPKSEVTDLMAALSGKMSMAGAIGGDHA